MPRRPVAIATEIKLTCTADTDSAQAKLSWYRNGVKVTGTTYNIAVKAYVIVYSSLRCHSLHPSPTSIIVHVSISLNEK